MNAPQCHLNTQCTGTQNCSLISFLKQWLALSTECLTDKIDCFDKTVSVVHQGFNDETNEFLLWFTPPQRTTSFMFLNRHRSGKPWVKSKQMTTISVSTLKWLTASPIQRELPFLISPLMVTRKKVLSCWKRFLPYIQLVLLKKNVTMAEFKVMILICFVYVSASGLWEEKGLHSSHWGG